MYINYEQTPDRVSGLEKFDKKRLTEIVLDF